MRRTKNFLVGTLFVLFAFTCLFSNGIGITKTNALSSTLFPNGKAEHTTVYYFSDSEPSFLEKLDDMGYQDPVIDVYNLLNEQELRYLIFSGYFWGFQSSENADENTFNHIAVIEIKTFKPSVATITNLVNCLTYQHVSVIFVSPFYEDYSDISGCFSTPCNFDRYTAHLRNSIRYMDYLDASNDGSDSTSVLLSNDFINELILTSSVFDIENIILSSPVLRRMLCYYYYGIDLDNGIKYEKEVYSGRWAELFELNLMQNRFSLTNYNFFDNDEYIIEDISSFVDLWEYMVSVDRNNTELFCNADDGSYYNDSYKSSMYNYYQKICISGFDVEPGAGETLLPLVARNFFVYVQITGYYFIDLTVMEVRTLDGVKMHTITYDTTAACGPRNRLYAWGTWQLNTDFYTILNDHRVDPNAEYINTTPIGCNGDVISFQTFIFEEDPIEFTENGLPIITDSGLIDLLGAEFDEYPNAGDLFIELFAMLFNQLTVI